MVAKIFHKNLSWASGAALNMLGDTSFFLIEVANCRPSM